MPLPETPGAWGRRWARSGPSVAWLRWGRPGRNTKKQGCTLSPSLGARAHTHTHTSTSMHRDTHKYTQPRLVGGDISSPSGVTSWICHFSRKVGEQGVRDRHTLLPRLHTSVYQRMLGAKRCCWKVPSGTKYSKFPWGGGFTAGSPYVPGLTLSSPISSCHQSQLCKLQF